MSMNRILGWFPKEWRSRYEVEVRDLLEAHPFTWRERRDLLRACLDAWAREAWSWARAISRLAGMAGLRFAVVLGVGWLGLQVADVFGHLVVTQAIAATAGLWLSIFVGFRLPMVLLLQWFLARPYAESGSEIDRPSWTQTIALTLVLLAMVALDQRGGPGRDLPDMLLLGITMTMRHARWFVLFDASRPVTNNGRRTLGLQ